MYKYPSVQPRHFVIHLAFGHPWPRIENPIGAANPTDHLRAIHEFTKDRVHKGGAAHIHAIRIARRRRKLGCASRIPRPKHAGGWGCASLRSHHRPFAATMRSITPALCSTTRWL